MSLAEADDIVSSSSPQIAPHPKGTEVRLIDDGLLHYEASLAGYAERYLRGETSHTIHVWWARRPHSAMRALVFASLSKGDTKISSAILRRLPFDTGAVQSARKLLSQQYGLRAPRVLDMFGGGGTIPAEAANLGAESYSIDANELSVFIQSCNLVYSQKIDGATAASLLRSSGQRVLEQLFKETDALFPLRAVSASGDKQGIFGYLWSYSTVCNSCKYRFLLIKRPWVSRKKDRSLAFTVHAHKGGQKVAVEKVPDGYEIPSAFVGRTGAVRCPECGEKREQISIGDCRDELLALVRSVKPSGKDFVQASEGAVPSAAVIERHISKALSSLNSELPSSRIPRWSGIANPAIYGIETHADSLNRRQQAVLLLLIKALRDEHKRLEETKGEEIAKFVTGQLSSLIDQLVDWNCRLSMWIPQNEQVGRAFCGPGISMLWDYIETDPLQDGPANLWSKLDRIVSGVGSIPRYPITPHVQKAYAQNLPFKDGFFDAVVTDPPYYDNIYYTLLSDFFYAWKRLLFRTIEPGLFSEANTDASKELVASKFRSGSVQKAHEDYCEQLTCAIREAARVLKKDGVFSFVYSHSSLAGWEAIVRAFREADFRITSVQPLSIERKARPRAISSEAVNTCIAFVAHKTSAKRSRVNVEKICSQVRVFLNALAPQLEEVNWSSADIALACYAQGVALLANLEAVVGAPSDIEALRIMEGVVKERFPEFRVQDRGSL
jgi:putative DNA methylase